MKYKEIVEKTGKIPTYRVEEEIDNLMLTQNKPSARILHTKIGAKTIALLNVIGRYNNHSWYSELHMRAIKKGYDDIALFYRGNKITYRDMFKYADCFAASLLTIGIKKGDEIACALANTPELVYIMLGANKIGAKLNLFGTSLNKGYMESILKGANQKLFIATDREYGEIKDTVKKCDYERKLIVSLHDSLPTHPELCDEYIPELDSYYHYDNLVPGLKQDDSTILSFKEFLEIGKNYPEPIMIKNNLDTEFTITYSSGSTRHGFPKQIVHSNRSYIVGGIYNDTNLTGSPSVPEIRGLAHIHSDSNTNLVTSISDNLIKHGSVALEPEYDKDKFLDYIFLNRPVHLDATTSFLIQAAKDYLVKGKFHDNGVGRKLPMMLVTMAVGEKTSPGEEKFINRFLKEASAGSAIKLNGVRLPYGPLSIGGGDCEHGGIYYTLLKELQRLAKILQLGTEEYGMTPVPFATVTALKKLPDGSYEECDYGEYGLIVANSITSMHCYNNDKEKTLNKIVRDRYGRDWLSCDTYGYINKLGNAIIKGRIEDNIKFDECVTMPCFMIDDIVCKDTKNIMSCTTVKVCNNGIDMAVINIEFSPFMRVSKQKALKSLEDRLKKFLPLYYDRVVIREMSDEKPYPLIPSGKRDIPALISMGLTDTFQIIEGVIVTQKDLVSKDLNVKKHVINNKRN